MAKKRSVEELYKGIFTIRENLQEVVQLASDVVLMSQSFGGEIPRVITEQMNKYFIPQVSKFIDDTETPGAITPLVTFLDSVPLAMTREEPRPQQLPPQIPAAPLTEPPTAPTEGSYAAQDEDIPPAPMEESTKDKGSETYSVYRKAAGGTTEGLKSKIKDTLISTHTCKEEAEKKAEMLNKTLLPEEKDVFETEYYSAPTKIEKKKKADGASKKVDESSLRFSDGENFDTSSDLHIEKRYDGYYVVGKGRLIPVRDREEAYEIINRIEGKKTEK